MGKVYLENEDSLIYFGKYMLTEDMFLLWREQKRTTTLAFSSDVYLHLTE